MNGITYNFEYATYAYNAFFCDDAFDKLTNIKTIKPVYPSKVLKQATFYNNKEVFAYTCYKKKD